MEFLGIIALFITKVVASTAAALAAAVLAYFYDWSEEGQWFVFTLVFLLFLVGTPTWVLQPIAAPVSLWFFCCCIVAAAAEEKHPGTIVLGGTALTGGVYSVWFIISL